MKTLGARLALVSLAMSLSGEALGCQLGEIGGRSRPPSDPAADEPAAIDTRFLSDPSLMFWMSAKGSDIVVDASGVVQSIANDVEAPLELRVPVGATGPQLVTSSATIRFESGEQASLELVGGYESLAEEITIAIVVRPLANSAPGRMVSFGADLLDDEVGLNWNDVFRAVRADSSNDYAFVDHAASPTAAQVVVVAFGVLPQALDLYVDGERSEADPVAIGSPQSLGYVARNLLLSPKTAPADFELGELMLFRRELPAADIASVSKYLGAKWSIPIRTSDDDHSGGALDFATIEGILQSHGCTGCHLPPSPLANVDLTTYAGLSSVVTPGSPEDSRLYNALDRMGAKPESSPLAPEEKQAVFDWISQGAPE